MEAILLSRQELQDEEGEEDAQGDLSDREEKRKTLQMLRDKKKVEADKPNASTQATVQTGEPMDTSGDAPPGARSEPAPDKAPLDRAPAADRSKTHQNEHQNYKFLKVGTTKYRIQPKPIGKVEVHANGF